MVHNILSVDVEDWYHPEALQHRFKRSAWEEQPQRVAKNIDMLLDLFAEKDLKATFFTLGWVAKHNPQMIKKIAAAGHEIASHGNSHRMLTKLTPDEFRQDLKESISILEDLSGQKIVGFRAPTFSVVKDTFWAWEIMLELGIKYDSSVYPIWHDRYGVADAPRFPYTAIEKNGRKLMEFPMPTLKLFGVNIPFGGGGYLRILPNWFTRYAIKRMNRENAPVIMFIHPWEFDIHQKRLNLGSIQTWRHYYNINNNSKKLAELLDEFSWTNFRSILE
ncbi:MAG: XrtA system polysaccharide deacetylase [Calditrichaceae bacterium]